MKCGRGPRRCAGCRQLFVPDPRSRHPQVYCARTACRAESKAVSQRKWASKPENQGYWRGEGRLEKVRAWRARNPGYWRRCRNGTLQEQKTAGTGAACNGSTGPKAPLLQEHKLPRDPLVVGMVAKLAGSTLQGQIEQTYQDLLAVGREILENEKRAREASAAHGRVSGRGRSSGRTSRNGR